MVTFQLSVGDFTASVVWDEPVHPDLLDELGRRCVRLFADGYMNIPEVDGEVDG